MSRGLTTQSIYTTSRIGNVTYRPGCRSSHYSGYNEENKIVLELRSVKVHLPQTGLKLKEWIDFVYPLVKEMPTTNVRKRASDINCEKITKKDIYALINRSKSWVEQCCSAGELLEYLKPHMDGDICADLKAMLEGKNGDRYGMMRFLSYLSGLQEKVRAKRN